MSADDRTNPTGTRRGLVGRVFGDRYLVTEIVSAGANTVIAHADDQQLGRQVTIKCVRPEWVEARDFRRRFARTMEMMSTLSHPNVAAVYDWGEEEIGKRTTTYVVVERLEGGSLRDLFDRRRLLDRSQALVVGLDACRGLDFAHRHRLVHTELTPSKLVFGDDRRLRIVDFGLARLLGAPQWRNPSGIGAETARYCSPEQALSQPVDAKTDVYALALILVEAVTGTVPFAARSTVATLSARVGRLMPVSADLGPLAAVLERAGRPEPADRSTAAEFGRDLVRVAEQLPRPAPIPIVVASVFEDDPNKLRRPNDPTGGVHRPDDPPAIAVEEVADDDESDHGPGPSAEGGHLEPPRPLVTPPVTPPPLPSSSDESGDSSPPPPGAALTVAAVGAGPVMVLARPTAPHASNAPEEGQRPPAPAADEPSPHEAPPDTEAGAENEATSAPPLYDGEADATVDELAALARSPAAEPTAEHEPSIQPQTGGGPDTDRTDRRGRRLWPWLLAVFVLLALAALGYLAYRLFRTPTHEVPALVGLTEADATRLTAEFDWSIEVELARSDEEPDEGQIIRTSPEAGEQLAEGEPFLIVVSEGPELRRLPELSGLPLSEAETALAELRLVALPATEQFDEEVPEGAVVSWSVAADDALAAGDEVLPETEVELVVSAGPEPRTIPDLTGVAVNDARAQLEERGLVVSVADQVFSDTVPVGGVVSTEPPVGASVERGSTVVLTPSKGVDLVVMPDLTGQTLPQIQATLASAGLNVGGLLGCTQCTFVSASVNGESAEPGDQYKRGTAIDLILL